MNVINDDIDFSEYMQETENHKIRSACDFLPETIAAFYPPPDTSKPPKPLWEKANGKIAFRPGEVSLWAGINGHGKSMMLSQVALDLLIQNQKILILSFEMKPARQMQRMSRQAYARDVPPVEFLRQFHQWTDGKLWMYDHTGAVHWQQVLAVCRYASEKFGITHFIIDSMMKCVKGDDDYNAQKDFVNELCGFAQARLAHVHLVHHVRKGESEDKTPGKFDIKGAGAITDQVDNIFTVWRNKRAEREQSGDPTAILKCDKQRNGEWEGMLGFWFHPDSMQYLEKISGIPIRYNLTD